MPSKRSRRHAQRQVAKRIAARMDPWFPFMKRELGEPVFFNPKFFSVDIILTCEEIKSDKES